tara:strand:- start:15 stop:284 length:270 start_codon:yes stop_codon:yes gene_type:complete
MNKGTSGAPSTLILDSVQTKAMNTYPTADSNGTISWAEAVQFAHSSGPEFMAWFAVTYWHMMGERIDLGELEALHTDWALDRIAALVFD